MVHVAKTAGTEINGEMAAHYERVCGNKGYSYDFHAYNKRVQAIVKEIQEEKKEGTTAVTTIMPNSSKEKFKYSSFASPEQWQSQGAVFHGDRGVYAMEEMIEIGFSDCDWITHEKNAQQWIQIADSLDVGLELHVPCRDELNHLMSMYNFQGKTFDCNAPNLKTHIRDSIPGIMARKRFSLPLLSHPNITLKCFDPVPPTRYRNYMGTILQRKRVESNYVPRASNKPRDTSSECIWEQSEEFQNHVRDLVRDVFIMHSFCHTCMGTVDELPI
jgi:hypothetical protein